MGTLWMKKRVRMASGMSFALLFEPAMYMVCNSDLVNVGMRWLHGAR